MCRICTKRLRLFAFLMQVGLPMLCLLRIRSLDVWDLCGKRALFHECLNKKEIFLGKRALLYGSLWQKWVVEVI